MEKSVSTSHEVIRPALSWRVSRLEQTNSDNTEEVKVETHGLDISNSCTHLPGSMYEKEGHDKVEAGHNNPNAVTYKESWTKVQEKYF